MRYLAGMSAHRSAAARAIDAARAGRIDSLAALQGTASIDVDASAETTFAVLTDLDAWPAIIPGVTRMRTHLTSGAGPRPGDTFSWLNQGFPLRSTLQRLEYPTQVCWTGKALWIVAAHCNTITELPAGRCQLTSTESMAGFGVSRLMSTSSLNHQLRLFVEAIAVEAERRTRDGA